MISAQDKLARWILDQKAYGQSYLKTSEIYKWGVENFSNRAVRNAQDMASKGKYLQRITLSEAILLGFNGKEGVWKIL